MEQEGEVKGGKRFTFAADEFSRRLCDIPKLPSTADLYRKSLNNRDTMRETLENAINSAFENILMWERMAHVHGFSLQMLRGVGNVQMEFGEDYDTVTICQPWKVRVVDDEKEATNE